MKKRGEGKARKRGLWRRGTCCRKVSRTTMDTLFSTPAAYSVCGHEFFFQDKLATLSVSKGVKSMAPPLVSESREVGSGRWARRTERMNFNMRRDAFLRS